MLKKHSIFLKRYMKGRLRFFIQFLISLCIIILLLNIIDPLKVRDLLMGIDLRFFFLLLVLITIDRFFMAYKWYLLLKARDVRISFYDCVKVYYISTFASFLLPTTLGADLLRVYKLHRQAQEGAKILSSVIIERLLGLIASALVSIFGIVFLIYVLNLSLWIFFWIILGLLSIFVSILIISFYTPNFIRVQIVNKSFLLEKLRKLYDAYMGYRGHRLVLIIFIALSSLEQLAPVIGNYLSALSIGLDIKFIYFLAIIPIVQLFNRLPVSFNGIGINEGLLIYFFSLLGLQKPDAFTIGLIGQVAILLSVLPAGLLVFGSPNKI